MSFIDQCLISVLNQEKGNFKYEILVVDDCSIDGTFQLLKSYKCETVRAFQTKKNSGPGIARNVGLNNATGNWILFLDSDDQLTLSALKTLSEYIESLDFNVDAIAYNWQYGIDENCLGGRTDRSIIESSKETLIKEYISLKMDGSVIYTLIKKSLIDKYELLFRLGYHEDVDFLFMVYWFSAKVSYCQSSIYIKNNRLGSIINTFSTKHIKGFFEAYKEIYEIISENLTLYNLSFSSGVYGVVATRLREVFRQKINIEEVGDLLNAIYREWKEISRLVEIQPPVFRTKYMLLTESFIKIMKNGARGTASEVYSMIENTISKTWSCYDLHHSLFLAPDEVRTCCKRFFVNGEMKGDVVIVKKGEKKDKESIKEAKKTLHSKINSGEKTGCSGCPFLEFKEWGDISDLQIEHISFEYHSVCNMKCTYCSETYYGGEKSSYDVAALISDLIKDDSLSKCKSIVWGGGEPVVDKQFNKLIQMIAKNFPKVQQRVLTNSIVYSGVVNDLLAENQVTVTTSIDAGTQETFNTIRGNPNFLKVFRNLQRYYSSNSNNLTIKYIFVENQNDNILEVKSFVSLIKDFGLIEANFQISFNFKDEKINDDTAIAILLLYGFLLVAGAHRIFLDDLLSQRLSNISEKLIQKFKKVLQENGILSILEDDEAYTDVVIWGAGWQTKYFIENSRFFRKVSIKYLVDDSLPNKIGEKYMGLEIKDPKTLRENNYPVLISAVQGYSVIHDKYTSMNLEESRLIKGLII